MIEIIVGILTFALSGLLIWAFRELPAERWQFVATIPLQRHADGHWIGLNLTFYGALTALGYVVAINDDSHVCRSWSCNGPTDRPRSGFANNYCALVALGRGDC